MRWLFVPLVCALFIPTATNAFTVKEAQVCADKLLTAYNKKTYPKNLLAVEEIIASVFGRPYRQFSSAEVKLALQVGEEHIRESFTKPSGKYQYQNLVVTTVKQTKSGGYRASGEVTVKSPRGNGRYNFVALMTSAGCRIQQVRIADVITLTDTLKDSLRNDRRVTDIFKS